MIVMVVAFFDRMRSAFEKILNIAIIINISEQSSFFADRTGCRVGDIIKRPVSTSVFAITRPLIVRQ